MVFKCKFSFCVLIWYRKKDNVVKTTRVKLKQFYALVAFTEDIVLFSCDKSDMFVWCLNNLFSSTWCNFPILSCFDPQSHHILIICKDIQISQGCQCLMVVLLLSCSFSWNSFRIMQQSLLLQEKKKVSKLYTLYLRCWYINGDWKIVWSRSENSTVIPGFITL